jgi:hypothetical protein
MDDTNMFVPFIHVKEWLDLDKDSYEDYPALKRIAETIKPSFENYLGLFLEYDSYTEKLWTDGSGDVVLRGLPVKKVKSVEVNGKPETDYTISQSGIKLKYDSPGNAIVIKYSGGFDDIPADIQRAALLQLVHEYQRHDQVGATAVQNDGGSVSYPQLGLLAEVKRLLQPYKNYAYWGL